MRFKILACSLILGLAATAVQAGTMTPTLVVQHRYDLGTGLPLPITFTNGRVANGQPGDYEISVLFTAAKDASTEKGWLSTAFNSTAANNTGGSNLALDTGTGWQKNSQTTDTNGPALGGVQPVFGTNQDAGTAGDLQGIVAALASSQIAGSGQGGSTFELRNELGTPSAPTGAGYTDPLLLPNSTSVSGNPTWVGSFFVTWNGLGQGDAQLTGLQYAFSLLNGTPTIASDDSAGQTISVGGAAATAGFGVPEPATLSLLGLAFVGGFGLIRRRS